MKKVGLIYLCLMVFIIGMGQTHREEIELFQNTLNESYKDKETSPLEKKDRKKFKGHEFYPISESYKVTAILDIVEDPTPFEMATSTDRKPLYQVYAIATFKLNGVEYSLHLYESTEPVPGYENHLFLPFTDATSGETTYGGGRYIDLMKPEIGKDIIIDFNKAYHPYCLYNHNYSCPIPPPENYLDTEVLAGIKL